MHSMVFTRLRSAGTALSLCTRTVYNPASFTGSFLVAPASYAHGILDGSESALSSAKETQATEEGRFGGAGRIHQVFVLERGETTTGKRRPKGDLP